MKIKNAAVALVLSMSALMPIGIGLATSEASAAPCVNRFKQASANVRTIDNDGVLYGTYRVTPKMWYLQCDTTSFVTQYQVLIEQVSKGCGAARNWMINPNIIGNWNLTEKTVPCHNTNTVYGMWTGNEPVQKSLPTNSKCLGANLEVDYHGAANPVYAVPSLCVTYN